MKELRPLKATNQRVTASNGKTTKIFARWQSGLETPAGYRVWKLRLEIPPSPEYSITNLQPVGATQ